MQSSVLVQAPSTARPSTSAGMSGVAMAQKFAAGLRASMGLAKAPMAQRWIAASALAKGEFPDPTLA